MLRLSGVLHICLGTRVFLLSSSTDANAEANAMESLEASVRSLRRSTDCQDLVKLRSVMNELIRCTDVRKVRLCKDACWLAHAAGYHAQCAEFFFSCHSMTPLSLNHVVINAAALSFNPVHLRRCLSSVDKTSANQGLLSHETLLVLRIYWQSTSCFLRTEYASHSRKSQGDARVGVKFEEGEETKRLVEYHAICKEAFRLLHLPGKISFDDWWSKSKRLVLYQTKDRGEAAVYEQHFSCWMHYFEGKSLQWFTPSFLAGMMRSCAKAERWDLASRYLELAGVNLFSGVNAIHDPLVQQCLNFFGASMQTRRGVVWMKRIRDVYSDYAPSVAVVHSAARLAGDAFDEELAVWCLQKLLDERQQGLIASRDIFPCLAALAKCRAKNFKKLLHALEESGLVKPTEEEWLHLDLLHSRHGLYLEEEVIHRLEMSLTHVRGDLSYAGFSVRNISLLLRILQEGEHAWFMKYYRIFTRELHVHVAASSKAEWVATALRWALSQGAMKHRDYEVLVKDAHALLGDTVGDVGDVPLSPSLRSTIRSRLGIVEQLWGRKRGECDAATLEMCGDISLARFVQEPRCLPQPRPPWLGLAAPQRRSRLWRAHDAFSSFAQREWRRCVQGDF